MLVQPVARAAWIASSAVSTVHAPIADPMAMGVVEARQEDAFAEVDDRGVRACGRQDVRFGPDGRDRVACDQNRFRRRTFRVHRERPIERQAGRGAVAGRSKRIAWTPRTNQPATKQMMPG